MEHLVFLDRNTLRADLRRPAFPHTWTEYPTTAPDEREARLDSATIAIVNKVVLDARALAQAPELRLIAVAATGVDNIDLAACRARGIAVTNIRRYAGVSVAEHVFMLMLALRRRLLDYRADLQAGAWQRAEGFCLLDHPIGDLHGATLGLVGHGDLGSHVASLARAFGMIVLVAERRGARVCREGRTPFDEVLARADVLSLHAALTDETRHMIGERELGLMPAHALLINTARGGLVDEAALLEALRQGDIAGAGLDVLETEPPRSGNGLLDVHWPQMIVTPHVAWSSEAAMQRLADQLIDTIERFLRGEPTNLVD